MDTFLSFGQMESGPKPKTLVFGIAQFSLLLRLSRKDPFTLPDSSSSSSSPPAILVFFFVFLFLNTYIHVVDFSTGCRFEPNQKCMSARQQVPNVFIFFDVNKCQMLTPLLENKIRKSLINFFYYIEDIKIILCLHYFIF